MIDAGDVYLDCGACGKSFKLEELYADASESDYEVLCRKHFYEKYKNRQQDYLDIVKQHVPGIDNISEYENAQRDGWCIVYRYQSPALHYWLLGSIRKAIFKYKKRMIHSTRKRSSNYKIKAYMEDEYITGDKFIIDMKYLITFKSYLEFLEFRLYLQMITECLED